MRCNGTATSASTSSRRASSAGASSNANARPRSRAPRYFSACTVVVERRAVDERREHRVDVPGRRVARAARGGPREPAARGTASSRARTPRRRRRRSRRPTRPPQAGQLSTNQSRKGLVNHSASRAVDSARGGVCDAPSSRGKRPGSDLRMSALEKETARGVPLRGLPRGSPRDVGAADRLDAGAKSRALFELPFNDLLFRAQWVHRQNFDPNAVQVVDAAVDQDGRAAPRTARTARRASATRRPRSRTT